MKAAEARATPVRMGDAPPPPLPESGPSVRASFELIVLKNLRPISLGLCALYLAFTLGHVRSQPPHVKGPMTVAASATAALLLGLYILLRRGRVPAGLAHPLGGAVAGLVLVNSLLHLRLTAEPEQTTNVALLLVAVGCFFLSTRWLALVIAGALVGWGVVASTVKPAPHWQHFAFMLFTSTILSLLIYSVRVRTLVKLENLRLLDARRKAELEEAIVAAQRSEEGYRNLVDEASDIIYRTDSQGCFTFFNPTAVRLLKRPEHELRGLHYGALIHPEHREAASKFYGRQFRERTPETYYEFPAMAGDGELIWLGQKVQLVRDGDEVVGFQAVARDITERKRADEALRRAEEYRNLFRLANDAIIIFEPEGEVVLEVNDKACEIYGFAKEDFLGLSLREISRDPRRGEREIEEMLSAGDHREFESVQLRSDGVPLHLHINASVIEYGGRKAILSINRDVTEHRRAEQALRESEAHFRAVFNNALDAILIADDDGRYINANEAGCAMLGVAREEVIGRTVWEFASPSVRPNFARVWREFLELGTQKGVFELLRPDGKTLIVDYGATANVMPGRHLFVIRDMTEQRLAESALRHSEARLAGIVESAMDAIVSVDEQQRVVLFNAAAEKMFRITAAEAAGRPLDGFLPERFRDVHRGYIRDFGRTGPTSRSMSNARAVPGLRSDGEEFLLEASISQVEADGQKLYTVIMRDITERKQTEEQLLRIRRAVEGTGDGIRISDPEGHSIYHNPAFIKLFGYTAEELDARGGIQTLFVDQRLAAEMIASTLGSGSWRGDAELLAPDGRVLTVEITRDAIKDEGGKVIGMIGIHTDITERKRIEDALRRSEEQYRSMVENAKDMIVTFDLAGRFTSANKTALSLTGYTLEEALRLNLWQVVAPESAETARQMLASKLSGAQESTIYELTLLSKDGSRIYLDVSSWLYYRDGVPVGAQAIGRDVGARKQLEEQLRQSQKMEAVGKLAGGIAHDFNNLLAVITMQCDIMLRKPMPDEGMRRRVEEIGKASERAASLTQQLLAFSRQQVLQPKVLDLNEAVSDTARMLRRVIGEDIQLLLLLDPEAGRVKVDAGQLTQVLLNLAVNARDAMPQGGVLTVETSRLDVGDEDAGAGRHLPPGPYVALSVKDTGAGMTPEVQRRIFEPFFTTKEVGKGSGLGLSTVYGIIKQSEGHVLVDSEPGRGTTFRIFLPQAADGARVEAVAAARPDMPRGTETVLLVEDEEMVRRLTREILEELGYTVLVAADGVEALTLCEGRGRPVDLVMTDVVMPRMSGRELVGKLCDTWPHQRVLYMSGYTDDAVVRHGVSQAGTNFIQKPFTPVALALKLREVLETPSPGPAGRSRLNAAIRW